MGFVMEIRPDTKRFDVGKEEMCRRVCYSKGVNQRSKWSPASKDSISSVAEKIMITFSSRGQLAGGPRGDWQEAQGGDWQEAQA